MEKKVYKTPQSDVIDIKMDNYLLSTSGGNSVDPTQGITVDDMDELEEP